MTAPAPRSRILDLVVGLLLGAACALVLILAIGVTP